MAAFDLTQRPFEQAMGDGYIRNRQGKIIGRETSDGWLRDGTGRLVAKHDKGDDRTRTREGKIVGSGDQRMRELKDE